MPFPDHDCPIASGSPMVAAAGEKMNFKLLECRKMLFPDHDCPFASGSPMVAAAGGNFELLNC